jgi:hypothetical protein
MPDQVRRSATLSEGSGSCRDPRLGPVAGVWKWDQLRAHQQFGYLSQGDLSRSPRHGRRWPIVASESYSVHEVLLASFQAVVAIAIAIGINLGANRDTRRGGTAFES